MADILKSMNNKALASMMAQAAPQVVNAIKTASARTGVDFAYLMEKAGAESSFNAKAKAKGSSATGLFQFIESTWLKMVKDHGHKYGLGSYADKIDARGRVTDPALRREILEMRKDPETSAFMAAEFAAENQQYLQRHLGADAQIGHTELYLAHFLGAGGAAGFLKAMKDNPLMAAADLFPKAARVNRAVFYDSKTGAPRTLAGIYEFFDRKFESTPGVPAPAMVADQKKFVPVPPRSPAAAVAMSPTIEVTGQSELMMQQAMLELLSGNQEKDEKDMADTDRRPAPVFTAGNETVFGGRKTLMADPVNLMILAQAPERIPQYNR